MNTPDNHIEFPVTEMLAMKKRLRKSNALFRKLAYAYIYPDHQWNENDISANALIEMPLR